MLHPAKAPLASSRQFEVTNGLTSEIPDPFHAPIERLSCFIAHENALAPGAAAWLVARHCYGKPLAAEFLNPQFADEDAYAERRLGPLKAHRSFMLLMILMLSTQV